MTSMMDMGYDVVSLQDWLAIEHNDRIGLLLGNILRYANHHMLLIYVEPWVKVHKSLEEDTLVWV